MLRYFESEQEAKELARQEIHSILSDKTYINPEKFSQLRSEYKRKQRRYDAEINAAIQTQVSTLQSSKQVIEFSLKNVEKVKQECKKLNQSWKKEAKFHEEMILYKKILTYRRNVKRIIDQLNDFGNLSTRLEQIQEIYKDPRYFEYTQQQLQWLREIQESLSSKLENDSSVKGQTMRQIIQKFSVVDDFEKRFYENIYNIISNCLQISETKPTTLVKAVKALFRADDYLQIHKKEAYYIPKSIETIKTSIDRRFREKFPNPNDLSDVIKNMDFTVRDLIIAIEKLSPCFPASIDIFKLFESRYKMNVENLVAPFLSDAEEIRRMPGTLVVIASWIDNYEALLKKAGIKELEYFDLKIKIKAMLPEYILYLENYMNEGIKNLMEQDKPNHDIEYLTELDKKNQESEERKEISSNFAPDLFRFINAQLETIGQKIKGETFMEVIRLWITNLSEFQANEKNALISSVQPNERLKIILYINNYYKCIQNVIKTENLMLAYAADDIHYRVENLTSILKKESIMDLLHALVATSFVEIESNAISFIFEQKWLDIDLMGTALVTLKDYYSSFKVWLISPLHYARSVRIGFEYLTDLYIERFLFVVRKNFKKIRNFQPKKLTTRSQIGNEDIIKNKDLMLTHMKQDIKKLVDFVKENYGNVVTESYFEKVQANFGVIFTLSTIQKFDFESHLHSVYENFKELGIFVLEAVMLIRGDCRSEFRKNIKEMYNRYTVRRTSITNTIS